MISFVFAMGYVKIEIPFFRRSSAQLGTECNVFRRKMKHRRVDKCRKSRNINNKRELGLKKMASVGFFNKNQHESRLGTVGIERTGALVLLAG